MVLCHNKKCIFIHIPKTAGTSIEQFLREKGRNDLEFLGVYNNRSTHHYTSSELKNKIPYYFSIYYKFSIVRNPYDRLLSEYYWCPIPNVGFKAGKSKEHFINYVEQVVKYEQYFTNIYNDHFIPQYLFLYEGNKLLVNQHFKYEDLDWIVTYLKKKLNIENELPYLNKTNSSTHDTWTDKQKERLYNIYRRDFKLFNYDK